MKVIGMVRRCRRPARRCSWPAEDHRQLPEVPAGATSTPPASARSSPIWMRPASNDWHHAGQACRRSGDTANIAPPTWTAIEPQANLVACAGTLPCGGQPGSRLEARTCGTSVGPPGELARLDKW